MCIYWASEVTIETGILVWKTGKDLILKFKEDATVIKQIKDNGYILTLCWVCFPLMVKPP